MNGPGRSPGRGPDLAGGPIASAASLAQSGRAGRLLGGGAGLALGLLALAHPLFVQPLPDLLLALASGHIRSPRSFEDILLTRDGSRASADPIGERALRRPIRPGSLPGAFEARIQAIRPGEVHPPGD